MNTIEQGPKLDTVEGQVLAPKPVGETLDADVWYKIINADKAGDPLLTFHGGPGIPSTDIEADEEALKSLGRPVIVYDQLGCGNSKLPGQDLKPSEEGYRDYSNWFTVERFVDEAASVWEHLKERFGYERVHLFGLSWGTKIALELILENKIPPEEIARVVFAGPVFNEEMFHRDVSDLYLLLGSKIGFGDRAQARQRELEDAGETEHPDYKMIWEDGFERRHLLGRSIHHFRPEVTAKLNASIENMGHEVLETLLGRSLASFTGTLNDYDRLEDLPRVTEEDLRVLITVGRNDEVTPQTARVFNELMAGPDEENPRSEMVVFEDSAHLPHLTEPDLYFAVVGDFLQRQETRFAK